MTQVNTRNSEHVIMMFDSHEGRKPVSSWIRPQGWPLSIRGSITSKKTQTSACLTSADQILQGTWSGAAVICDYATIDDDEVDDDDDVHFSKKITKIGP